MNTLGIRILSAMILIPPVLAAVYFGRPWFEMLMFVMLLAMAWEWARLVGRRAIWLLFGLFYLVVPVWFLVLLRADTEVGRALVFWLLAVVWASDTGAYVVGSLVGGPKLAPAISPNKTWSGLAGALASGGMVGWVGGVLWMPEATIPLIGLGILLGFVGQMGDLLESWIKRSFGVKDTSKMIPGHGGILDRVDALMAVSFVMGLMAIAGGGSALSWL